MMKTEITAGCPMSTNKMRVWWVPQVGAGATFYVPVESVEEAKKVMDILAAYDCFQYNYDIKGDFCNTGGLEVWDDEEQDWNDWYYEDRDSYYESVDDYCDEKSEQADDLNKFSRALFDQVVFD